MPELPEVETTKEGLRPLLGQIILKIDVSNRSLRLKVPNNFESDQENASITDLSRRSKYLLIHLSNSKTVMIHLGMSGRMKVAEKGYKPEKHDHIIWHLEDKTLIFNDARRFGLVDVFNSGDLENHKLIEKLGPEPLEDNFNADYLRNALKNKKVALKTALMDSHIVVGVGNIYASESLFRAGIAPTRPANKLNTKEAERLVTCIKETLSDAIAAGGSSLRDYAKTDGQLGYFQHQFQVYGREGEPCKTCATKIVKQVLAQRSTFHCPQCQPI